MSHALRLVAPATPVITGEEQVVRATGTNEATRFKPGQSGNPKGRPKGSRHKLGEEFLADLYASWLNSGRDALERVRRDYPVEYVRILISILPKDAGTNSEGSLAALSDQELEEAIAILKSLGE